MPKILLADVEVSCDEVSSFLEKHGCQVTSVNDIDSMKAALSKDRFDLLILEPYVSCTETVDGRGMQAFLRIVSQKDHPPIIITTVFRNYGFVRQCAAAYLHKPYLTQDLLTSIQKVLQSN